MTSNDSHGVERIETGLRKQNMLKKDGNKDVVDKNVAGDYVGEIELLLVYYPVLHVHIRFTKASDKIEEFII